MARPALALTSLMAFVALTRLDAQSVRGIVTDGQIPVPGVVVQLIDSIDAAVSRALTDETGAFRLRALEPGRYRLRTMRIGFRPTTSERITLVAGEEVVRTIAVAGVAFSLDTVRVVTRGACRVPGDSAAATFVVWEQARTALTATALSTRERGVAGRMVSFERVMDRGMSRTLQEHARGHGGFGSRAWRALPADSLHRTGYVITDPAGDMIYYAPDIDVLLSQEFAEDHCFRLVDDRKGERVGITFEPTRARDKVAEIRGTMWLDRKTTELRSLEFRYVNVSRAQMDANAGGGMSFVRLVTGAWAITRWDIRMPVLVRQVGPAGGISGAPLTMLDETVAREIRVSGGQLSSVVRGRDTLWAHPPLAISGVVMDSATGRPVAGARVALRSTPLRADTDSSGRFVIENVLPDSYVVTVAAGAAQAERAVTVVDAPVVVRLRVNSVARRAARPR